MIFTLTLPVESVLFSLNLCSKLVLLPDGQCLISVDALPSAVSENIFVGQLELIDSEDAVSNKSSAVNSKRLIAVQFNFQCFHKLPGSKRQLDAKTSTALFSDMLSSSEPVVQQWS